MQYIERKISLEAFRSRMPSVIPAITEEGIAIDFTPSSIIESLNTSNYGLLPSDLDLSGMTIPVLEGTNYIVSYTTVSEWYRWMRNYHQLLIPNVGCGSQRYRSIRERNEFEEESVDEAMDEYYESIGGDTMYQFLYKNIFPTFIIPEEYADGWNFNEIPLVSLLEYNAWFKSRDDEYKTKENIPESKFKDYEKYLKLGGKGMSDAISDYLKDLKFEFSADTADRYEGILFNSYINLPISISTSVENLGDFSILYDEWEEGKDYHTVSDSEVHSGGTIVAYDNLDWILDKGETEIEDRENKGSLYSNLYKSLYFGTSGATSDEEQDEIKESDDKGMLIGNTAQWARYINYYMNEHPDEFLSHVGEKFAYKGNNLVILGTDSSKSWKLMTAKYEIQIAEGLTKYFQINDGIFQSFKSDCVEIEDKIYPVYYTSNYHSKLPYIIFNGKRIYGTYSNGLWEFKFIRGCKACLPQNGCAKVAINNRYLIEYKGMYYYVNNDTLKIPFKGLYKGCNGVIDVNGTKILLDGNRGSERWNTVKNKVTDSGVVEGLEAYDVFGAYLTSGFNSKSSGYSSDENYVYVIKPYTEYVIGQISGYTESKLSSYKSASIYTDNLGNPLNGEKLTKTNVNFPIEGEILAIPYHIGTSSKDTRRIDNGETNTHYFFGGLLTEMYFYTIDENGSKKNETRVTNDSEVMGTLNSIYSSKKDNEILYCEMTYIEGATFKQTVEGDTFSPYEMDVKDNAVTMTYKETFIVTKQPQRFYVHACLSYDVLYYDFTSLTDRSSFCVPTVDYAKRVQEDYTAFPVFRREEDLGLCCKEKVSGDIYVYRGMETALNKQLKLMEIHSVESLEKYSNNEFLTKE